MASENLLNSTVGRLHTTRAKKSPAHALKLPASAVAPRHVMPALSDAACKCDAAQHYIFKILKRIDFKILKRIDFKILKRIDFKILKRIDFKIKNKPQTGISRTYYLSDPSVQ
jgi:hypothetical protein